MKYSDLPPNMQKAYDSGTWTPLQPLDDRGGSGGGGSPSAAPAAAGGTTNTAGTNPQLDDLWKKYQGRFDVDNTKRQIEKSTGAIADSAALLGKDARASLASRGASGSGVGAAFIQKHVTDPAQRQAAGAAADITMNDERRKDQLVLGGTGLASAGADLSLRDRELGLRQQQMGEDNAYRRDEQKYRREDAQTAQWMALMGGMATNGNQMYAAGGY